MKTFMRLLLLSIFCTLNTSAFSAGISDLDNALDKHDLNKVKQILQSDPHLARASNSSQTLFDKIVYDCCTKNAYEIAKLFVDNGADVNGKTYQCASTNMYEKNCTLLFNAKNNAEMCEKNKSGPADECRKIAKLLESKGAISSSSLSQSSTTTTPVQTNSKPEPNTLANKDTTPEPKPTNEQQTNTITVSGTVVDAKTNEPLFNVKIMAQQNGQAIICRSGTTGARTDFNGKFTVNCPVPTNATLQISLDDYQTLSDVAPKQTMDIKLYPMSKDNNGQIKLEEVKIVETILAQGTIVDANTNTPLTDGLILVYNKKDDTPVNRNNKQIAAHTNAAGQFKVFYDPSTTDINDVYLYVSATNYSNNNFSNYQNQKIAPQKQGMKIALKRIDMNDPVAKIQSTQCGKGQMIGPDGNCQPIPDFASMTPEDPITLTPTTFNTATVAKPKPVFDSLDPVLNEFFAEKSSSVWKNDEGKFNTARLASDSIAGVVLGTAGGVITSKVIKKNQLKKGFEDLKCTIGGQTVASFGDEFNVGKLN